MDRTARLVMILAAIFLGWVIVMTFLHSAPFVGECPWDNHHICSGYQQR